MANRITHEYNTILSNREAVTDFYSKGYLSRFYGRSIALNQNDIYFCDSVDMFYRLKGYELFGDKEENARVVSSIASDLLGSTASLGACLSFTIFNYEQTVEVFFGSNHRNAHMIKNGLTKSLSTAEVSNEWITPSTLNHVQQYNGIIVGLSNLASGEIDRIISSLQNDNYLLSFIFIPIERSEIIKELQCINTRRDEFQRVSRRETVIGSTRARRYDNDDHQILEVIEALKKEAQKMERGLVNGLWYVASYISSDNQESFNSAAAAFSSLFRSHGDSERDESFSQVHTISCVPITPGGVKIPTACLCEKNYGGLFASSLLNICDLRCASSLLSIPQYSHMGYSVKHYGESSILAGAFEKYPTKPRENEKQFILGKTENGNDYLVPVNGLRQHAFITGATQFGKSTSIRKILVEASKYEIPFVVIEAAKKEYWELKKVPGLVNVGVYSSGMDANELTINPFQPEDNTVLDSHIQSLIQAFLSLFDQADPLPQILTELIYICYEKKGWDVSKRVPKTHDLEYPILSDMLTNLDECIDSIGYSDEVRDNMKGVIRVRLSALIRQAGKSLNTRENLSIDQLFRQSAVVELDDYSDRNKPFVASVIAIKASEYSKQCATGSNLRRILVIEEAHHIIPNPEQKSVSANAALCSKYFSNMLAEVSAYGTGVVIVDQRPSAVASAAIANTGFKLVHNLHEGEDLESASAALSLKTHEKSILPRLRIGEAIVTVPQTNEVSRVRISADIPKNTQFNLGLLFCEGCNSDHSSLITDYELSILQNTDYSSASIRSCISNIENRNPIILSKEEKIMLAGDLVSHMPGNVQLKRQKLYEVVKAIEKEVLIT